MNGSIDIQMIKENADGSADFVFNLSAEYTEALLRFGIIKALEAGIKEAQENYTPSEDIKAGETD